MGESISDRCEIKGLRMTYQRCVIASVIENSNDHPDVELIYERALEKDTTVSLATVYNTVHAFKNNGYLKEISLQGNKTFFDTNTKTHHHFYDKETGNLMDINNEEILVSKIPSAPKGKKIKDIEVTVNLENNNQNQKK